MQNKAKKFSVVALLLCALAACAALMTACGTPDMSNYTYQQYAETPEATWNKKTISYQIEIPLVQNATAGTVYSFLFNLYEDGSMLGYQSGIFNTGAKDAARFDEDRYISWAYFGKWAKSDDGSKLDCYYFVDRAYYGSDDTIGNAIVEMTDAWVKDDPTSSKFHFYCEEKTAGSGEYVLNNTDQNVVNYIMLTYDGDVKPIGFNSADVLSGSNIKYKTLQDFVDSYMDEPKADV